MTSSRSSTPSALRASTATPRSARPTRCFAACVGSNTSDSTDEHAPLPRGRSRYGRGGIRTHAGVSPHDFQSCALSHSATRPELAVDRPGTRPGSGMDTFTHSSPSTEGVGLSCGRSAILAPLRPLRGLRVEPPRCFAACVGSNFPGPDDRSVRVAESHYQRREWDSNPRGP